MHERQRRERSSQPAAFSPERHAGLGVFLGKEDAVKGLGWRCLGRR